MRWPKLSVRQMMGVVAIAAVLYLAVIRGTPALVLANYHRQRQHYHETLLASWMERSETLVPTASGQAARLSYLKEQAAYHAYWKRVFLGAAFRVWERLPVTSQAFPPRRPLPIYWE